MLRFLRAMVLGSGWPLESVLPLMTSTPARILKLPAAGRLAVGCQADVLLLEVRGWLRAPSLRPPDNAGMPRTLNCLSGACRRCCTTQAHLLHCPPFFTQPPSDAQATTLEPRYMLARGELVLTPEWVQGGMFERGPGIRPRRPIA